MITGLIIIMTDQQDIRELLENLGSKVSTLAEENRAWKNRDEAGQMLINLLEAYISKDEWMNLYKSTDDPYIKKLMINWGAHLFPEDFL